MRTISCDICRTEIIPGNNFEAQSPYASKSISDLCSKCRDMIVGIVEEEKRQMNTRIIERVHVLANELG